MLDLADVRGPVPLADRRIRVAAETGLLRELPFAGVRIGAPVTRPGKVVCIGLNYRDHAQETGAPIPSRPVVFLKDPATVVGPRDTVSIPRGSTKTDWEVELAVVIGKRASYLDSPNDAAAPVIAGYTISNDVSEREFQLEYSGQRDLGKSCETFNPLGPWLVTPDEVDPQSLALRVSVDGVPRQHGNTENMIFDVPYIVWYLSQYMVLEPGDVINTGTPTGVALGLPDTPYLRPGDVVELEIAGLGTQRQVFEQA
ncbi:fumarylacetoacetate hydrolase family protein [Embleya sp. NBC_00888]|uniref:fumarylacetoacetate hydrolase family protein n=1 Tax=Embleya sp. NBC_00888 TaxID=2975960 RepID=UPI003866D746